MTLDNVTAGAIKTVSDWSDTVAGERISVWAGDDSDSVIGQFLQVRDQLQQARTWFIDDPARVDRVGSVVRVQNFKSVEALQLLQTQEVAVWHVMMSEKQQTEGFNGNQVFPRGGQYWFD